MTFIASILTTLIAVLVFLNSEKLSNKQTSLAVRSVSLLIAVVAAISSVFKTLIIIPVGSVGVVELFGQVAEAPLNSGIHLVNPFADVEEFSTRLRDVKETVEATSAEGLGFTLDVSLQYKLDPSKAVEFYKSLGTDETEIVTSRFRSSVREITASYPAEAIYSTKRQEVANRLSQRLSEQLFPLGFVVEEALLREVKLPEKLQNAVEQKLAAEQESQQMKFTLTKAQQEAERKRIEARGISDSQKIISQGLNSQIIQLRAIEATEKLAGSDNTKVVVVGGAQGGVPVSIEMDSVPQNRQPRTQNQ